MAASQHVTDVTAENFPAVVVEGSKAGPVVVDFWAPWCGPCRQLGPALEARAAAGGFTLAKVNVDENPDLAAQFEVSSIPAVYAVKDAKVVDHFVGMLAEDDLDAFVAALNPTEADRALMAAADLAAGDPDAAKAALRELVAADPAAEPPRLALASLLVELAEPGDEAAELLRGIESGKFADDAGLLRRILALRQTPHTDDDLAAALAEGESAERQLNVGTILAAQGEYERALEALLAGARLDKQLANGPIREAMVNVFHVVGVRSDLADEYRDKLQALLY